MDTENKFMVSVTGGGVLVMNPPRGVISKEDALMFAAWLVALADHSHDHEAFEAALTDVESV